jgi:hypothetical protein
MVFAAALLAGGAAVLIAGLSSCSSVDDSGGGTGQVLTAGPGAYDVIKMCRFSDEEGPVFFAHRLHADLTDVEGNTVPCVRCHHELKTEPDRTPRGCSRCHLPHDHIEARELLTM